MSDYNRGPNDPFRPENGALQQSGEGSSVLTDAPAQLGAQMQQGGVPLPPSSDFSIQGDDAPTRVVSPVMPAQLVSRRTTVDRPSAPEADAQDKPPVRRRSRVAERAQAEAAQAAAQAAPEVDPFRAGDSEEPARQQSPAQRAPLQPLPNGQPVRRPAPQRPQQPGQRPAPQRPPVGAQGQPPRRPVQPQAAAQDENRPPRAVPPMKATAVPCPP